MKTVKKEIEFALTQDEIVAKAMRVAELSKEIDTKVAEARAEAAQRKDAIKALEVELEQELDRIRSRKESRVIECEVERDFMGNTVRYIAKGKVLEERAMDDTERQMELADGEPDEMDGLDIPDELDESDDDGDDDGGGEPAPTPPTEQAA